MTLAETKEDQELDDQVLKLVASKDPIAARRMREDFWRFEPTHKSLLLTNHRPRVKGQDWGVWRRIVLVPWLATVRETDKDLQLPAKLRAELPGILAWAAAGCLDVQREGLRPPRAVQEATDGYRSQENAVARWVVAECNRGPDFETKARDLCSAYNSWALVSRESRLSERAFADRLKAKPLGFEKKDRRDGAYWQGLKLKAR